MNSLSPNLTPPVIKSKNSRASPFIGYLSGIGYLKYRLEKGDKVDSKTIRIFTHDNQSKKNFTHNLDNVIHQVKNQENLVDSLKLRPR